MLRITEYIRDALSGRESGTFNGSILIWNLTNTCNLSCRHCYSSANEAKGSELSREEALALIPQLRDSGVKAAILSGGEPLMREDLFEIAAALRRDRIRTHLSSNGTLINWDNIKAIREHFDYVGISLDGEPEVHDGFRGRTGAFKRSLDAIRLCLEAGMKVGLRFSLAPHTSGSLPFIFDLAREEGVPKIYISHLVYAGRGRGMSDLEKSRSREAVGFILGKAFEYVESGVGIDIVTGNNEADAVLLLAEFGKRHPANAEKLREKLKRWSGNQAGMRLVNIGSSGDVKPDPFFFHSVGNVREKSFSEIWNGNGLLPPLRETPRRLKGRCGDCGFIEICNGNSRARAFAVSGDYLEEDPGCFLE